MKKNKQPKCKNCWDKGFSSEYKGKTGNSRITLDPGGIKINYCNCDKGRELSFRGKSWLVVGNAFENPELLK